MEDLFKKISLDTSPPHGVSDKRKKRSFPWKFVVLPIGVIIVLLVAVGIMFLPMQGALAAVRNLEVAGKELGAAVKNQDLDKTKIALGNTREKLTTLSNEYKKMDALKIVPFLGSYVEDGEHAINAGFAGLDAGDKAMEALEPNADLLGLKGKSTFVSGSADERLQMAVKTMRALTPKINEMAVSIDRLRKEVDSINPNRYPVKVKGILLREQIVKAKDVIDNAANLFVNAQPLLVNLPTLLGDPTEKRYLVLFQNDKELRATGGFITAYAQFRLVKGKAILEKADDIYALDASKKKNFPAPREILTFHKGVYNLNIRDANLSPDFKVSMQQFEEIYDATSSKEKIDGIWAVDTHVLVEALKILGPTNVYGREFSAEIDKRCDCPKAVYELEDYSTRPVGYVREARKDIIGVLLQSVLQKALGVSPSQYWGKLFQMLISEINEKHVLAYFHDADAQKAAESFNMAGRIMTATETATLTSYQEGKGWDYLHVNNSNMAGAKSNMFVSQNITKDVTVNGDGIITTKLVLDYKNPYPGSDCGLESGGLCLNAPLRDWVRVYVPLGSKLADSQGSQSPKDNKPVSLDTYDSLGKTVFEGFLIVNPLGTAKLNLTYTSPVTSEDGKYHLFVQKQPGTDNDEFTLKIGGNVRKKLPLISDTDFVL